MSDENTGFPDPLYVKKTDETYLKITGAKCREKVNAPYKPGINYQVNPVELLQGLGTAQGATCLTQYLASSDFTILPGTPVPPRVITLDRDEYVYYDSPTLVLSCTTVNGDNTITIPAGSTLVVGMAVAGTGIATGARIASIAEDGLSAELTQPATASGTVNLTFTGNRRGACWVDEWADESPEIPAYL